MTEECRKLLPQLNDWFEGCADGETKLLVQWHLRNCPHCQRLIAEWQEIASEIGASLPTPVPKGFEEKLRERLSEPQLVSWRELTISWALTNVGVAFVAFWFGISLTEIFRSIPQWVLSIVSWSVLPAQWLQQLWEIVSRWA